MRSRGEGGRRGDEEGQKGTSYRVMNQDQARRGDEESESNQEISRGMRGIDIATEARFAEPPEFDEPSLTRLSGGAR